MHLRTSRLSAIELNIWKICELLLWGTKPVLLFRFVVCCGSQLQYSKDYKRGSWIEWNAKMGFIDMCFRVGATFEWSFNLHWLWGCSRLSQNMHPSRKIPSEIELALQYTLLIYTLLTLLTLLTLFILLKLLYTATTLACMPVYIVREG